MEAFLCETNSNSKTFACWAGFIHHPGSKEPDLAKYFFCFLELESWEPDHDPWLEDSKRTRDSCGVLSLSKSFDNPTVEGYYKLEMEWVRIFLSKTCRSVINAFEKEVSVVADSGVAALISLYWPREPAYSFRVMWPA
uniref:Uncharacterized protein n=1 Tax=Podarcis muralis TaxID=64176 RepID=A0A670JAG8_PODMU